MTTTAPPPVRAPLVAWRGPAFAVLGVAVLLFAAMVPWVHDTYRPNGVDRPVAEWLWGHFGEPWRPGAVSTFLRWTSEPVLSIGAVTVVAVVALVRRAWSVAVLAVVGPGLGLVLESYVLKPLIHRRIGFLGAVAADSGEGGFAFPSGHETGIVSALAVLVVLLLRTGASRAVKVAAVAVAAVWAGLAALGLVSNGYHYFTDTWGGLLLGVAVVLGTALAVDAVAARVSSPGGRDRPRTAAAA